jgi:hypothetical protein
MSFKNPSVEAAAQGFGVSPHVKTRQVGDSFQEIIDAGQAPVNLTKWLFLALLDGLIDNQENKRGVGL